MSQNDLGKHLGVTFRQIQKYEKGDNRLSGSRLIAAAKVLGTLAEEIVGSKDSNNGAGEYFKSLSEPAVIALVRLLEDLPKGKRRVAARAMTNLLTAF